MKKDGNVKIFVFLTGLLDETANHLETASWAWWAWWASHLGGGRLSGDRAIVLRIGKNLGVLQHPGPHLRSSRDHPLAGKFCLWGRTAPVGLKNTRGSAQKEPPAHAYVHTSHLGNPEKANG